MWLCTLMLWFYCYIPDGSRTDTYTDTRTKTRHIELNTETYTHAHTHSLTHALRGIYLDQNHRFTWISHSFSFSFWIYMCTNWASKRSEWLWVFSCLLPMNSCYEYVNDNEIEDPSAYRSMYVRTSTLRPVCMCVSMFHVCIETRNTLELN